MKKFLSLFIIFLFLGVISYPKENTLSNGLISLEIKYDLSADIYLKKGSSLITLANTAAFFKIKAEDKYLNFPAENTEIESDKNSLTLKSKDSENKLEVSLVIKADPSGDLYTCSFDVENISSDNITLSEVVFADFVLDAKNSGADSSYKYWTFQGATYISRPDWILKLTPEYQRENFMGNNSPDYGGGIPVVDFWTKEAGIAFTSLSEVPRLIYMPVKVTDDGKVSFNLSERKKKCH